jgi:hypothetical protein
MCPASRAHSAALRTHGFDVSGNRVRRLSRALALALAAAYALLALDSAVISVPFLTHLLPVALVLAGAGIGWERPRPAAIGFAIGAAVTVPLFHTWSAPERFLLLTLPLLVIAGLHRLAPKRQPPS